MPRVLIKPDHERSIRIYYGNQYFNIDSGSRIYI